MAKIRRAQEKLKILPYFAVFCVSNAVLHTSSSPLHTFCSKSQSFCITSFKNRNGCVKTPKHDAYVKYIKTNGNLSNLPTAHASATWRSVLKTLYIKFRNFSKFWGDTGVKPRFMSNMKRTAWPTIKIFAKINTLLQKNSTCLQRFSKNNCGGTQSAILYISSVARDHFLVCIRAKFLIKIYFFLILSSQKIIILPTNDSCLILTTSIALNIAKNNQNLILTAIRVNSIFLKITLF